MTEHFSSYPGEDDRPQFAQEAKGIGLSAKDDMPEWRKASFGGKKVSYGRKTNLSILEQRQSLPIYKLRDELVKVILCCQNMLTFASFSGEYLQEAGEL